MLSGLRKPQKTAVFISGSGSTLQSLLEMQHQFEIALVVSQRKNAYGLIKAKRFGRSTLVLEKNINYDELHQTLLDYRIERILLAGFLKLIPESFVNLWKGRIVNIHPSLLPQYPGLDSAKRSWLEKSQMGVSIHFVTKDMDEGKLFLQQSSLKQVGNVEYSEAEVLLRRTEQHLLRELTLRWN